ncbi:ADP-ribosylglycohydrolase family protein [Nocardiopsis sp. NPDC058631]|uniref:ADP-ribosylglycohydrolase family protein n=1 Tax=Nocardiopsis sp. NPDC058631 TaxID=3346566 RepID=UPI00365183D4
MTWPRVRGPELKAPSREWAMSVRVTISCLHGAEQGSFRAKSWRYRRGRRTAPSDVPPRGPDGGHGFWAPSSAVYTLLSREGRVVSEITTTDGDGPMSSPLSGPRPAPRGPHTACERDRGCVLAAACGDAFGSTPSQRSQSSTSLRATGTTALMAVLAEHLSKQCEGREAAIDRGRLVQEFTDVWQRDPDRGFGAGEIRIFLSVVNGVSWESASVSAFGGTGSYGAGAAARVAPVGLLAVPLNRLVQLARDSAYVTHAHALALDGAAIQACAVAYARRANREQPLATSHLLSTVARYSTAPEFRAQLARLSALGRSRYAARDVVRALGEGDTAVQAVPLALAAFLRSPDDLPEAVRFAVRVDGGRGRVAAMAGALAGARNGVGAIPRSWLRSLEDASEG